MNDMKLLKIMLLGSLILCLNACALDDENILGCRQASGIFIEDAFFMGEFDEIKTTKDERVIITEGPFFSVVVEAPESIMEIVDLDNDNGRLVLRYDECIVDSETVTLFVTMPSVRCIDVRGRSIVSSSNFLTGNKIRVEVSGSASVDLGVLADELDLRVRSNGELVLEGLSERLDARISGNGRVAAFDLTTDFTAADISGDGELLITVHELLDANINGSGALFFKGFPFIDADVSADGILIDAN